MINRLQLVTLFSFALACAREQPAPPAPGSVDPSGPLEIEWHNRLIKPWEIEWPSGCDELTDIGWSRNTGEFMFCMESYWSGTCDKQCEFHQAGDAREHVSYGDVEDVDENDCDEPLATLEPRLIADDFHIEENWAYGADVVLVVAEELKEPDSEGRARRVMKIGARLRSEGANVAWVDSIDECEGENDPCELGTYIDFHIDGIASSANGQTIAVLAHALPSAENFATHPLRFLDARMLADAAHDAEHQ